MDESGCTHNDQEKENTSPSPHFTPLPWDSPVSTVTHRKERVEAPTHAGETSDALYKPQYLQKVDVRDIYTDHKILRNNILL